MSARESQYALEPVTTATPRGRLSQYTLEPVNAATPRGRLSQYVLEVIQPTAVGRLKRSWVTFVGDI